MALALLGALLISTLVFVHLPASLWAGNVAEFDFGFGAFLIVGIAAVAAGVVIVALAIRLLPPAARLPLAGLIGAVGILCWIYSALHTGRMTVLNGLDAPMRFDTWLGAWELPVAAAAVLVMAWAMVRAPQPAMVGMLVLNAGLAASTSATLLATTGAGGHASLASAPDASTFRFSAEQNVLVLLLDGLQAHLVEQVFTGDEGLQSAFEGFSFYRDTLAVAPTTLLNMPTLHSGAVYRSRSSVSDFFTRSIERDSFVSRFARAGYEATVMNPIEGVCPAAATCTSAARVLRSGPAQLAREGFRLLDLSLFRVAPVRLKSRVYADGNWLLSGRIGAASEVAQVLDGRALLVELARRLSVSGGPPTLKFVHSLATHTPYVLNRECRTDGINALERAVPQARCALSAVAALLARLKSAGIYDNTVVLVLADHGMHPGVFGDTTEGLPAWQHMAGSANPAFLLKERNAHGPLRVAAASVYLADVGATLCAASGACTTPFGIPAGLAPADRPRRFHQHAWRHEFWQHREVPGVIEFEVRGPVWDERAWHRVQ